MNFFPPTLDNIITRSISHLPTVYIYFPPRSPFLLSVAGQCSDPFARDQLQTGERSQPANRVALGEYTPDSLPPPSPLNLSSRSSLTCPALSSSVHRCAPLAPRTLARDSSRAVQFELTLSNTSCTLCRRTCEGLLKHIRASFSFITKFVILMETLFFLLLLSFVFCLVLTRRAIALYHNMSPRCER